MQQMQPGVILYFFIQGEADEVAKQRGVPFVLEILIEYIEPEIETVFWKALCNLDIYEIKTVPAGGVDIQRLWR